MILLLIHRRSIVRRIRIKGRRPELVGQSVKLNRMEFESPPSHLIWSFGIAGAYAGLKNQRNRFNSCRPHFKLSHSSMAELAAFNGKIVVRFHLGEQKKS